MEVRTRFNSFLANLRLTTDQREDGQVKHARVRECLNLWYYNSGSFTANSFLVGSWAKGTRIRPPRDIDIMFVLPEEEYTRFRQVGGNRQSKLLQDVKSVLQRSYPTTEMSGDGQVVMVPFASYSVEVVPAFALKDGQYLICNTNDGGSYKRTDPKAEMAHIERSNRESAGNTRDLIRMMKRWQEVCSVPLKSFWIELLVVNFLSEWHYRGATKDQYHLMVKDFIVWLNSKAWHPFSLLIVPGTGEWIWIGNDWGSKAASAKARALKAYAYENDGYCEDAGAEWQKIFGDFIPMY